MGCNCSKTEGFKTKLAEANKKTEETGEVHVVYVHKLSSTVFMRKLADINDGLGICCYFLPDGTEVEYNPSEIIETTDEISDIEIKEESTETSEEKVKPSGKGSKDATEKEKK